MKAGDRSGSAELPNRTRHRRAASAYVRTKTAPDRRQVLEPSTRSAEGAEASAERSEGTMEARRVETSGSIHDSAAGKAGDATNMIDHIDGHSSGLLACLAAKPTS